MHYRRITKLRRLLQHNNCASALISKKEHIRYLTGLAPMHATEREAFVLITPSDVILYHSPFIIPPSNPHLTTMTMSLTQTMATLLTSSIPPTAILGIEKQNLTVAEADRCQEILPKSEFIGIDMYLQELRESKDNDEIFNINKACNITKNAMNWAINILTTNQDQSWTERDLAHEIEHCCIEMGADGMAFPTIVAFGAHSASPHHIPSSTKLQKNTVVLIDMGAQVNGYVSDMTRTFFCGSRRDPEFIHIESIVLDAYQTAAQTLSHSSITGASIDQAARNVIEHAGYGDLFIHTTSHGVGLEAHEGPHINQVNHQPIPKNAVITIEPGIYMPGKFGYRHEDTFLVTTKGPKCLTG